MAHYIASLLVLCAVAATVLGQASQGGPHTPQGGPPTSQGGPHEVQGRVRRQVTQDGISQSSANWTSCDVTTTPYLSCQDCKTRLICKPVGGLQITCSNPLKPYCNRGVCSSVPTADCA